MSTDSEQCPKPARPTKALKTTIQLNDKKSPKKKIPKKVYRHLVMVFDSVYSTRIKDKITHVHRIGMLLFINVLSFQSLLHE